MPSALSPRFFPKPTSDPATDRHARSLFFACIGLFILLAIMIGLAMTDFATRGRTGEWWRRDEKEILIPPVSIQDVKASAAPGS